jgi:prevent-host-death family protein
MTRSTVGVHEAKTHLSRLLERVGRGEEVAITRRGQVVAHLVPPPQTSERRLGLDVGRLHVPGDFDAPLPGDVLDSFSS